jgi:hypothetical protein
MRSTPTLDSAFARQIQTPAANQYPEPVERKPLPEETTFLRRQLDPPGPVVLRPGENRLPLWVLKGRPAPNGALFRTTLHLGTVLYVDKHNVHVSVFEVPSGRETWVRLPLDHHLWGTKPIVDDPIELWSWDPEVEGHIKDRQGRTWQPFRYRVCRPAGWQAKLKAWTKANA